MTNKHPRQHFTEEEDIKLSLLVQRYGEKNWRFISSQFKDRNERQCKERWVNFLSPDINKGEWTQQEDLILIEKYYLLGSQWKEISKYIRGRTHISVRNRCQKLIRKNIIVKFNNRHVLTNILPNKNEKQYEEEELTMDNKPEEKAIEDSSCFYDLHCDCDDIFAIDFDNDCFPVFQ